MFKLAILVVLLSPLFMPPAFNIHAKPIEMTDNELAFLTYKNMMNVSVFADEFNDFEFPMQQSTINETTESVTERNNTSMSYEKEHTGSGMAYNETEVEADLHEDEISDYVSLATIYDRPKRGSSVPCGVRFRLPLVAKIGIGVGIVLAVGFIAFLVASYSVHWFADN